MKIIISGASGLVGKALTARLSSSGHEIIRLVRRPAGASEITWNPQAGEINGAALEGADAVVHLAGESIAGGRWTLEKKAKIRDSRVKGTRLLSEALAGLETPPKVLVSASAIGYYGNRGDEVLTESSPPGHEFLSEVCQEWEAAADPAREKGIRVVHTRFGIILDAHGGALGKMLPPFRLGLGGIIGNGRQFMSWVSLDDVTGAIEHAINTPAVKGPTNVVSPNPVRNFDFTGTLGYVLGRPVLIPIPAQALRLMLGDMADALLLSSTRVQPDVLLESDYAFQYPRLEEALKHILA